MLLPLAQSHHAGAVATVIVVILVIAAAWIATRSITPPKDEAPKTAKKFPKRRAKKKG